VSPRSYLIVNAIEDEESVEKRSYLIVNAIEDEESVEKRSYLIVNAIEDEGSVEKRAEEGDVLINEAGVRFVLVPESA
jgi:predicted transcriptional regulator